MCGRLRKWKLAGFREKIKEKFWVTRGKNWTGQTTDHTGARHEQWPPDRTAARDPSAGDTGASLPCPSAWDPCGSSLPEELPAFGGQA